MQASQSALPGPKRRGADRNEHDATKEYQIPTLTGKHPSRGLTINCKHRIGLRDEKGMLNEGSMPTNDSDQERAKTTTATRKNSTRILE
jgi:hypothetical protein